MLFPIFFSLLAEYKEMRTLLDVHTHTIASGHAFSTIQEMIARACELRMEVLGITEHGPAIPGAPHPIYFKNLHVIPREVDGLRLLLGAEINILDTEGNLDMDADQIAGLDLCIAGIHSLCWKGGTREENTRGMIRAIQTPGVHIISHPGDGAAELDFRPIVEAAKESHTLLEINSSSLNPARHKREAHDGFVEILRHCKDLDVPVILASDAHVSYSIGDYRYALPLLEETEFPAHLVMNGQPDFFFRYLDLY